jgi:hypothetical protein
MCGTLQKEMKLIFLGKTILGSQLRDNTIPTCFYCSFLTVVFLMNTVVSVGIIFPQPIL